MQENLREFSKKIIPTLKTACVKAKIGLNNVAYLLIPVILLLTVGIIARTQEEPFQINDFTQYNEEEENTQQDYSFNYEPDRVIPEWVKPARWFRSNSGGMPLEEMKSRIAAMRGKYALVIDFTSSDELPESLLEYYDENFFIEIRTLYKEGKEDRTQWIFRDENYGVRLIAVLFEAQKDTDNENIKIAPVDGSAAGDEIVIDTVQEIAVEIGVIQNIDDGSNETAAVQSDIDGKEIIVKPVKQNVPARGFVEIYDDKYHLTTEYRYFENGENNKIVYYYNNNIKITAQAFVWDNEAGDYVQMHTDYYLYNRSSFLRAVERVFHKDQQISTADSIVASSGAESSGAADNDDNNTVRISFPSNILAAARNIYFMGEKFNSYPEFFGDLAVLKDSKLIFTTDDKGKVLAQTLVSDDDEQTVIWKIENTWSGDRIVKITKTEGETVLLAEYVYNKNGDKILERNIKDGVLERVVRTEGKTDIEELYLNDKVVLQAVWEDGRKISESRISSN